MFNPISYIKIQLAYFLFSKPVPIFLSSRQKKVIKQAKKSFLQSREQKILVDSSTPFVIHRFNSGPNKKKALVLHGWVSKSLYMIKIIEHLINLNYEVVALDFPAHGDSPGFFVNWQNSVNCILKSESNFGVFDVAIGHSYGGTMLLSSTVVGHVHPQIKSIFSPKKIITIASPVKIQAAIELFASILKLNELEITKLTSLIEKKSGIEIEKLDIVHLQKKFPTDTEILCIHDENDSIVSINQSQYLAEIGPRVKIEKTKKLGHIKIIYNDLTMQKISDFLK